MRAVFGLEFDGETLKLYAHPAPPEATLFREAVEGDGKPVTAILRTVSLMQLGIQDSDPWKGAIAARTTEDGRSKLWIENAEGERLKEAVIAVCSEFYPQAHVQLFDARGTIALELFLQE